MSILMDDYGSIVTRTPAIVTILKQVQVKIDTATAKGDTTEVARLKALYTGHARDYFIEAPVTVKGDYKKFCFMNRITGFAVVDQDLKLKGADLLETLKALGEKVNEFETEADLRAYIDSNPWDIQPWTFTLLKWRQYDKLILLNPWSVGTGAEFTKWVKDLGFMIANYSYDSDNWFIRPWIAGQLTFADNAMEATNPVPCFSHETVIKWLEDVPCARVIPAQTGWIPGNGLILESKVYSDKLPIPQPFTVDINGQTIKYKNVIRIKEVKPDNTEVLVPDFTMDPMGVISFDVSIPPTPSFDTYPRSRTYKVYRYLDNEELDLNANFNVDFSTIPDQSRVTFALIGGFKNGAETQVEFRLKDSYYPAMSNVQLTDVLVYVDGKAKAYFAEQTPTGYMVRIPTVEAVSPFILKVTSSMQRRISISAPINIV